jgi:hypothetical protein
MSNGERSLLRNNVLTYLLHIYQVIVIMPSKSLPLILVISALLSLAAIAMIPISDEANAKECNDNGHDSCSDKQDSSSNNHKHSSDGDGGNSAKKDKTPFVLPFP